MGWRIVGWLDAEGDAAVGGELIEDIGGEGGDARLGGVAGGVVEGELSVMVAGDQDEVAAAGRAGR